jgi:hypothetical protein
MVARVRALVRVGVVAIVAMLLAPRAAAQGDGEKPALLDPDTRKQELDVLKPVFDKYYEAGSGYYEGSWRGEALWCFERAIELIPEAGGLRRFTGLLRDYDNPIWKRRKWKSPKAFVEAGFKKKKEQYDQAYATALLKLGSKYAKKPGDPILAKAAHERFLRALELVGGPYDLDAEGRLVAGKAGTIPADVSKRMLVDDLVLINGKRWLRDSMLRSLKSLDSVHEARDDRILVRTVTSEKLAADLLALLKLAYPQYEKQLGERATPRPLGLFVFPDAASYQEWCKSSDHADRTLAAGFATSKEGFAVTYAQAALEPVALHEVAHLWYFDVYASEMPSWYAEGTAEFFGNPAAMRYAEGKLETGLKPTRSALAASLADGHLRVPLGELLSGDASVRINAKDGSAEHFYREAWALYWFLSTTKDARFAGRFADWEAFGLGSRWTRGDSQQTSGAQLFDKLFAPVRSDLEAAFTAWAADPQ